ncbi:MAG: cobalt transporter CbiM, partial [Candidatus Omnitrophota bacterium]|nr:cobalt transporter CbiM [Candidatus Omnitrophota bacterium]
SFVIMMFNVPIPGGTTGHAVGGVLVAILLGPWAACIAITVALVILALLFGDGGITTLGANCFNMAFILPFTGYYIYRAINYKALLNSKRRVIAAGVAGYLAITLAALFVGIELGLQSLLQQSSSGGSFYFPYGLKVSLPVMLEGHLFAIGWVEAVMTGLVIKYLQKYSPKIFAESKGNS